MKKLIGICAFLLVALLNKAQYNCTETQPKLQLHQLQGNLLFNASFEDADEDGLPNDQAQATKMHSWDDDMRDLGQTENPRYMHSPDWIYMGLSTTSMHTTEPLFPFPKSGRGMIAVRNYELIEQNFRNEDMTPKALYVVSLNIYLSSTNPQYWDGSSLKCYLAKQKMEYAHLSNPTKYCTEDYTKFRDGIAYPLQEIKEIASWHLDLSTFPNSNGWVRVEKVFEAPDVPGLWDYFGIDLIQEDFDENLGQGLHCEDGCVFIDDVSIRQIDQCGTTCSPDLNVPVMSCLPNAMVADGVATLPNGSIGGPFIVLIQNAIGIDFIVDNTFTFNSVIHRQYAYDPNGLIDAGFPDYMFAWIGYPFNNTANGLLPQDVYAYKFRVWNCKFDTTYLMSLTYIPGAGGFTQGWDIQNSSLNDCCPQNLCIQNKVYPYGSTNIEKADLNIDVGYSVCTPPPPFGDVICDVNSNVKFVGYNINLASGFIVLPGAEFEAIYTGDCIHADVQKKAVSEKNSLRGFIKEHPGRARISYSISPNPSVTGKFIYNFDQGNELISKIEVFNSFGQQILVNSSPNRSNILDLSAFGSGIYIVKTQLSESGNFLIDKVIVP